MSPWIDASALPRSRRITETFPPKVPTFAAKVPTFVPSRSTFVPKVRAFGTKVPCFAPHLRENGERLGWCETRRVGGRAATWSVGDRGGPDPSRSQRFVTTSNDHQRSAEEADRGTTQSHTRAPASHLGGFRGKLSLRGKVPEVIPHRARYKLGQLAVLPVANRRTACDEELQKARIVSERQ